MQNRQTINELPQLCQSWKTSFEIYSYLSHEVEFLQNLFAPGGEFEIGTEKIQFPSEFSPRGPQTYRVFKRGFKTLGQLFAKAKEHFDRECIVYEHERYTYRQLFSEAHALGEYFVNKLNIKLGERVGIVMRNNPQWIVTFVAATSIGAIVVLLNSWLGASELDYCVQDSSPRVVICDPQRFELLQQSGMCADIHTVLVPDRGVAAPVDADRVKSFVLWAEAAAGCGGFPADRTAPDEVCSLITSFQAFPTFLHCAC